MKRQCDEHCLFGIGEKCIFVNGEKKIEIWQLGKKYKYNESVAK